MKLREGILPWTPVGVALPVGVGRLEREGPGRRPGVWEGAAQLKMDCCKDAQRGCVPKPIDGELGGDGEGNGGGTGEERVAVTGGLLQSQGRASGAWRRSPG